jgi:hypothetical protein
MDEWVSIVTWFLYLLCFKNNWKLLLPSFTNKQMSSTIREKNEKKMKWKRKRKYNVYFDPMTWISSKQQYFIAATLPLRVANWPA